MIAGPLCERMLASASGRAVVQKAHSADDPVGPPATRAVIDFMLAIHGVVTAAGGIMPHVQIPKRRIGRHTPFLSGQLNGRIRPKLHDSEARGSRSIVSGRVTVSKKLRFTMLVKPSLAGR
jgi:hypothetical protein